MAKDKSGKDLPRGVTWLPKKGLYMARFMCFLHYYGKTAKQAAKTLADKRYEVEHGQSVRANKVRLDAWYATWMDTYKISNLKETSLRTYKQWYGYYISPYIGNRYLAQIKPVERAPKNLCKRE